MSIRFQSSRGDPQLLGFSQAIVQGLAPDGGLYLPSDWPRWQPRELAGQGLPEVAEQILKPLLAGDPLAEELPSIAAEAFDFPAPLVPVFADASGGSLQVLELFHGPTAAFKDFGARFLAACIARLPGEGARAERPLHILVATSGDTGGAVAAAFHRRAGCAVSVLFPRGLVSPTQERQLTCWDGNVQSFAVEGTFDDCQRLVKMAFLDPQLARVHRLSSANSINLGRLLPQAVYYATASLTHWRMSGRLLNFIIPSGNLGNAVACFWARRWGLPIGEIRLAHNANLTVPQFLAGEPWAPRPSVATLASAMDVGNPSNMERLQALFPDVTALRSEVKAIAIDDESIRRRIRDDYRSWGRIWCPHTAVAAEAWARLSAAERADLDWCIVATASPAKFAEIVEPLIEERVVLPASLQALFDRPVRVSSLEANLDALRGALQ